MKQTPFQDILEKAAREKREETKRAARASQVSRIRRLWSRWRAPKPVDPEGFGTYWKLTPGSALSLWDLAFMVSLACFGVAIITASSAEPWTRISAVSGMAALLLGTILVVKYLRVVLGFFSYRGWRASVPFPISGWDEFFHLEHALSPYHWRVDARITLVATPGVEAHQKLLEAMTYLFCKEANGWIYDTDSPVGGFSGDPRRAWKRIGNELYGSANIHVMGQIQELLVQLAKLAKTDPVITAVKLTFGTSVAEIEPVRYSPSP